MGWCGVVWGDAGWLWGGVLLCGVLWDGIR